MLYVGLTRYLGLRRKNTKLASLVEGVAVLLGGIGHIGSNLMKSSEDIARLQMLIIVLVCKLRMELKQVWMIEVEGQIWMGMMELGLKSPVSELLC